MTIDQTTGVDLRDKLPNSQQSAISLAERSSRRQFLNRSVLSAALVGAAYWSSQSGQTQAREFKLPDWSKLPWESGPVFHSRMLQHQRPLGFVHCASICQSSSGRSLCAWYGGSREGARDVKIWMASLEATTVKATGANSFGGLANVPSTAGTLSSWSNPRSIMDYPNASAATDQFVRKVGNSLIFYDQADRLWLVYVSIAMGGWSTSSLNVTYSDDHGVTWSNSRRLWLSPLLNLSELVRCPPVFLQSGEVGIPIYHECAGAFPELLWLNSTDQELAYRKSRICGGRDWMQPSIVPTGPTTAICYMRCTNSSRRVGFATTDDAGLSWSSPDYLQLPNPNSSISAVALQGEGVLMACNDSALDRDSFSLAFSPDGINDWRIVAELDRQPGQKYSYPCMVRGADGLIHLVYSWQMKKIRHVCFNDAWVRLAYTDRAGQRWLHDLSENSQTHRAETVEV